MGKARDELHETIEGRLHVVHQRYTSGRRALVDALAAAGEPLTIEDIIRAAPDLALSSAYRNLAVLEQVQIVHRIVTNEEFARYELTEELTGHHHHLVCASCGVVRDATLAPNVEQTIDRAINSVATQHGFTQAHHRLDLIGLCADCSKKPGLSSGSV